MCQLCLIYFYFFNIYICTKRYHSIHKYQQVNFFSNVVKSIRPTYGNKEELATLNKNAFQSKTYPLLANKKSITSKFNLGITLT